MRKFIALAIASTFLTAMPVAPTPVEARSLFESLFPQASERRRARKANREQRRLRRLKLFKQERARRVSRQKKRAVVRSAKPAKIKQTGFKTYFPRKQTQVPLARLAKAFVAYDKKWLAEQEKLKSAPSNNVYGYDDGPLLLKKQSEEQAADPTTVGAIAISNTGSAAKTSLRLSQGASRLKQVRLNAPKSVANAVVAHYKKSPEFAWLDESGHPTARARQVLAVLQDAGSVGLFNEHYEVSAPNLDLIVDPDEKLAKAMTLEFALTVNSLRYANDARHGLVDPNRISGYHDFKGLREDNAKLLTSLTESETPGSLLLDQNPRDKAFDALKAELAVMREAVKSYKSVTVRKGTLLKPGQTSDQLENIVESIRRKAGKPVLEEHFDVFAVDHSDGVYTDDVVALVRDFQRSVKLKPDGIVGRNTIARMNIDDPGVRLNKVLYAMERLRWHPDRLGNTHVFINQPAYRATLMRNDKSALSMRAVVGKTSNQTNFFHDQIEYVEYNPYWGVPKSILVNEMLPKLRSNASYLDNLGYEITTLSGRRISSSSVNWWSVGADFPFNVRQPPGPKNALGEVKIMFPNKHSIYMHDTPARNLFSRNRRAFSHGCVRLAEPRKMAAAVLGTSVQTVSSRIAAGKNRKQQLSSKIPVYVSYFTAWPDDAGKVKFYRDVYGRDAALAKAFALENKVRTPKQGA